MGNLLSGLVARMMRTVLLHANNAGRRLRRVECDDCGAITDFPADDRRWRCCTVCGAS